MCLEVLKMYILNNLAGLITPWRIKYYSIVLLVGIFVAVLFAVLTARDGAIVSGRLGGDFPAFYVAGKLVIQGESQSIYNPDRILSEQRQILPTGGYLPFVNPPHFAYFYALFGLIPYNFSFFLHYCFLVLLLFFIVRYFTYIEYGVSSILLGVLVACLTFYPLLKSVLGGQNSVISLFLLFLVWKLAKSGKEWLAGLCLGLLLYKPQFAIPFIGLFFLAGYWRVVVSAVLSALGVIFGTVFVLKHDLHDWLAYVLAFSAHDANVNKINSISLPGVITAFFGGTTESFFLTKLVVFAVVVSIAALWYRGRKEKNLNELVAATCPAILLIPQHVMYYDLSVCVLSVLLLAKDETVGLKVAPVLWGLGFTQILSDLLGFSPLFLVVLCIYIYFFRFAWSGCKIVSSSGHYGHL